MAAREIVTLTAQSGERITLLVDQVRAWMVDPPRTENLQIMRNASPVRTMIYIRDQTHPMILYGDHSAALELAVTGVGP